MATMLELPRELYLEVCSYLKPIQLIQLSGVSRDHYLAVQQPLFRNVSIYSFNALVKLQQTTMKVPVVSHIGPKQRQYWYKLSDAELRERDIKNLMIQLQHDDSNITGAIIDRSVGSIARKCPDVQISLTLNGIWPNGVKQLEAASMANVTKLCIFANRAHVEGNDNLLVMKHKLWDLVFSGVAFPDLKMAYITTAPGSPTDQDSAITGVTLDSYSVVRPYYNDYGAIELAGNDFRGLVRMETIKLHCNDLLTAHVLNALFNSSTIPKRLTTLEIVNCPHLHPVGDLAAIATLLYRGLQLLQHLRLHLLDENPWRRQQGVHNYNAEIDETPEHHLCNIVREFGQKIKSLDLAIPFACKRMLIPRTSKQVSVRRTPLELPTIPQEPSDTLQQRLIAQRYKYRRLIVSHGVCRGSHDWDELVDLAVAQEGSISWDLVSRTEGKAVWCVGGCLPVERELEDALS